MRTIEQPRIAEGSVLRNRNIRGLVLDHLRRIATARTSAQIAEHIRAGAHWEDQAKEKVAEALSYLSHIGLIRRVGDSWIAYRIRDMLQ